jgi:hypothetical protein
MFYNESSFLPEAALGVRPTTSLTQQEISKEVQAFEGFQDCRLCPRVPGTN